MKLFNILFPKRCVGCGRLGNYFCNQCRLTIQVIESNEAICPMCQRPAYDGRTHPGCQTKYALDGLTSFFRYDGVVRKAVKAIKYRYIFDLAQEFISLIPSSSFYEVTKLLTNKATILVPIPLHPTRFRDRGFNQAQVLGAHAIERFGISIRPDLLRRIKKTTPQVEMKDRDKRLKNMTNVFAAGNISVKNVILFDDVFTTGATMRSAANVLKRAGTKVVWAVTIAR